MPSENAACDSLSRRTALAKRVATDRGVLTHQRSWLIRDKWSRPSGSDPKLVIPVEIIFYLQNRKSTTIPIIPNLGPVVEK
jgi:hypothetical protein